MRIWALVCLSVVWGGAAMGQGEVQDENMPEHVVIEPPRPSYPEDAADWGLAGLCNVRFSVENGTEVSVDSAYCTAPAFCQAAISSVMRSKMQVTNKDGTPGRRADIVYPFVFTLDRMPQGTENFLRTLSPKTCPLGAIS